ncbi:redoxin domain-containing protein [Pedobacter rhizosphaerae]|uniref:Peroxiredoxin n=1 Tax=Pedobacter rhizosphaerae TaxID=390241 RepID=A0A1H9NVG6_9SPHI|nr:redoxin domain-containing protein [Pedobacter rhizosphaerae]SER39343.1 Peroxiredoxin [Pedobacter rhizosphaerae]
MALKVGDIAPDFKLYSSELTEISLAGFKGKKVIIHFFPLAFTGTCTEQLCTMRDNFSYYEGINAQVIGISVDSPFSLAKFKEAQSYQFPLLSDFNKEVSKSYGAFYDEFVFGLKGISKRAAFVIDEAGKIVYAEILEDAKELPDFKAINDVLKASDVQVG